MQIVEYSMTPAPKLVYVWKAIIGLVWATALLAVSSIEIVREEFNSLVAASAVIVFGNFIMVMVLLLTAALHKKAESFIIDSLDVGNACLIALAVGGLLFISIESMVPLKVSLAVVSIISSLTMGSVVIYMSTKLLNGDLLRVTSSNMRSVLLQAGIMYGVLLLLGY